MNQRTAAMGGYYFCYFAAQACMAGYLNLYLQQVVDLEGGALGWFNGLTALAPAAVLPVIGWWADRTGWGGWMLTGALSLLLVCGSFMQAQTGLPGLIAWGMGWEIARSACVSLADKGAAQRFGRRYGAWRSLGSLGFLTGGAVMGWLTRRWGLEQVLFPVYLGLLVVGLLFSFSFHAWGEKKPQSIRLGQGMRLLQLSEFRLALMMAVVSSIGVSALQPWLGSHLVGKLGAENSFVGWNTLCCVAPELVLLPLFSGKLVPRWGCRTCFLITSLALGVRCLIYALAATPGIFLVGSLLYSFSVCGQTAVSLAFLRQSVPRECYTTAVTITAAVSCIGRAAAGWGFGMLYQFLGSRSIFWLVFVLVLGAVTVLRRGKT